jgi:hypothetical protein
VSFRVASRIANTLRAGHPARAADELNSSGVVLFHAPPDLADTLLEKLSEANINWSGKALIVCDCEDIPALRARFEARGASTAVAREFGIAGRIALTGTGPAMHAARRMARDLRLKAVEILPGATDLFEAAMTLSSAGITPLIDHVAGLLRAAGARDAEAARIAAALFAKTANEYDHSGKQSWVWYMRRPEVERIQAQISAAGARAGPVLRQLLLFGFETFEKYADAERDLRGD